MDPAPDATWAGYARRRELAYQVAPDGGPVFRPRVGAGTGWAVSAGRGTVYATATARPREGAPVDLSLIDLDEGFRMLSRVVGIAPEDVRIGMRVVLDWEDVAGDRAGDAADGEAAGGTPVPVFRPEAGA